MSVEQFYIPKRLDDAPRFLMFSLHDALVLLIPLAIGMIMGWKFFTLIFAYICNIAWKKIKGSGGRGALKALIYWHYPKNLLGLKYTPDAAKRIYIS